MSNAILSALSLNTQLTSRFGVDTWVNEQELRAKQVAKYRKYYDGEHDVKLTDAMKEALREKDTLSPFSDNYCELVVDQFADRLTLQGISADNEAATKWAGEILTDNRLDGLQTSIYNSTIMDGETFLLVDYFENKVRFTHETAYDGSEGMLILYERTNATVPTLAIKVWLVSVLTETVVNGQTQTALTDVTRTTVYYSDRIERYENGVPITSPQDIRPGVQENPLGRVPVIHFKNKPSKRKKAGKSEIASVIPLQNTLNRTLVSMVMTSEYTAFQMLIAYGFDPPTTVSPGGWIKVPQNEGDTGENKVDRVPAGSIEPFVAQANWIITQIATVSKTPLPGFEQSGESGEAKKQREAGMLAKIRSAHVSLGNAWEDVMRMAWDVQDTYGSRPPAYTQFTAKWVGAEVRNDSEVIANANAVREFIPRIEYLRLIAPVFGWTDQKIQEIADMSESEEKVRMARLGVPTFA